MEKWYGTVEQGDKKGILVVVTTGKDGALTGGPAFMKVLPPRCSMTWSPSRPCPGAAAARLCRTCSRRRFMKALGAGLWALGSCLGRAAPLSQAAQSL